MLTPKEDFPHHTSHLLRRQGLHDGNGDLLEDDLLHLSLQLRGRDSGRGDNGSGGDGRDGRDGGQWRRRGRDGGPPLELLGLGMGLLGMGTAVGVAAVLRRRMRWRGYSVADRAGTGCAGNGTGCAGNGTGCAGNGTGSAGNGTVGASRAGASNGHRVSQAWH